jgi:hypothetical protein
MAHDHRTVTPALNLSAIEAKLLRSCAAGNNLLSSDRPSDKAKTRLKKRGLLYFDRSKWVWTITPEGHAALTWHDRSPTDASARMKEPPREVPIVPNPEQAKTEERA